jgi:hypothetical protein
MHAATDDVAAAIVVVVVVVVRVGIVSVVVGAKAKPYKRTPVKSATVEPTPHEASMKATTVEATASEASMEAGMMSLTRLGHFRSGIIRQSKERSR